MDFGAGHTHVITRMRFYPRPDCGSGRIAGRTVEASHDGKTWEPIAMITELPRVPAWNEVAIPPARQTTWRFVRFNGEGCYLSMAEVEFFGR